MKLKPVKDKWFLLGTQLGVEHSGLEEIKKEVSDAGEQLIQMLKKWLDGNPKCSWIEIIIALKDIDQDSLADKLAKEMGCPGKNHRP